MLKQLEAYIMEQALMMPGLGQGLQAAVRVFALLPVYIRLHKYTYSTGILQYYMINDHIQ